MTEACELAEFATTIAIFVAAILVILYTLKKLEKMK